MREARKTLGAAAALCLALAGCAEPAQEAATVPRQIAPVAPGNP